MRPLPDGTYSISVSLGGPAITDIGIGRFVSLLNPGSFSLDAHEINLVYNIDRGAYSLQFAASKHFVTYVGEPGQNRKLVPGYKPRYFKIAPHEYEENKYSIWVADGNEFHVGTALERIYPPFVAMLSFPEVQAWVFKKP